MKSNTEIIVERLQKEFDKWNKKLNKLMAENLENPNYEYDTIANKTFDKVSNRYHNVKNALREMKAALASDNRSKSFRREMQKKERIRSKLKSI